MFPACVSVPGSLALLTDLYQVTMAQGYYSEGIAEREAVFHLFFRKAPFNNGFAVCAGLEGVIQYLNGLEFDPSDIAYLAGLRGNDLAPLFSGGFLDYLAKMRFSYDIAAMPEGTVCFPNQPLLRVQGPLIQCQLIETALLNQVNFSTLIATKAARISGAAEGEPVLEFGLRRAQGLDGGLSASRAAYIGGCAATSNVLAGKTYGIPVKGTHAHSWVMAFDSEGDAFHAYARAMPNNCVLLVDTYDSIQGVRNAIETGRWLKQQGKKLAGIRLDSGDMAALSQEARSMLDEAGFQDCAIVASNDLDENSIGQLKQQGAKIGVWGVGTKLATAYDQPALGGVYKLAAIRDEQGVWRDKIKRSDDPMKVSIPGIQQVRRLVQAGRWQADLIYEDVDDRPETWTGFNGQGQRLDLGAMAGEDLLVPIFRAGACVYQQPALDQVRAHAAEQIQQLARSNEVGANYFHGLESRLSSKRNQLIARAEGQGVP